MEALVRVRGVHKTFVRGSEKIDVLQGLDLEVGTGEFLALMGPSGSGKSTLLNLIGGLDRPSSGSIEVEVGRTSLGGAIEIVVRDTGCGIPAEHLARIWEPYVTHKPGGTGLGLALLGVLAMPVLVTLALDRRTR